MTYQTEDSDQQWLRGLLTEHLINAEQAVTLGQKYYRIRINEHLTRSPRNQKYNADLQTE